MYEKERLSFFENTLWILPQEIEKMWKNIFATTFPGSQAKIMYLLLKTGPQSMTKIAVQIGITKGAVSIAANHLIENNYVERVYSKTDRRIIELQITSLGKKKLAALQKIGNAQLQQAFQYVSADEIKLIEEKFQEAINALAAANR